MSWFKKEKEKENELKIAESLEAKLLKDVILEILKNTEQIIEYNKSVKDNLSKLDILIKYVNNINILLTKEQKNYKTILKIPPKQEKLINPNQNYRVDPETNIPFTVIYKGGKNVFNLLRILRIINFSFYETFPCWELCGYIPSWALSYLIKSTRAYKLNIVSKERGKYDYNNFKYVIKNEKCNKHWKECKRLLEKNMKLLK